MASDVTLSLEGKVSVITGGSRGIGAATVRLFVRAGAKVVFNYVKSADEAGNVVAECGAANCHAVQADLIGTATAESLVRATVRRFGALDILVGNHGIWPPNDVAIDAMPDARWRKTVAVNLDSMFALVKHSVAQMKRQRRGGHIVLVSSTAGQRGEAGHADYAATKGALISMVKGLSTELAPLAFASTAWRPDGLTRICLPTRCAMLSAASEIFAKIPLGRAGTPDEIAGPILFLCTQYAGFITGEVFNVNGGAVLAG